MARTLLTSVALIVAVLAAVFQLAINPKLVTLGKGRVIEPVANDKCKVFPELQACEKLTLHQPSGIIYLACSTPSSRSHWTPAVGRLNATGKSTKDYIATFDPATAKVTHLKFAGFDSPRGISVHGMDVVPFASNSAELFVYLVNHRTPEGPRTAKEVGADSSIEVFKTTLGGSTLTYVRTFEGQVIATPNDVVGAADGKSVYFTNDHGDVKTGFLRDHHIDILLKMAQTNVGFCHADQGCKIAIDGLLGANGITKGKDGQFFVASSSFGQLSVLEEQSDNTLVVTEVIYLDRPLDNLSLDHAGAIWGAGLVDALHLVNVHFETPSIYTASSAIRFSPNTGQSKFYGEKYKVEKLFEDDGQVASGSTSAVYDSERKRLFLHGLCAPHLTMCELIV